MLCIAGVLSQLQSATCLPSQTLAKPASEGNQKKRKSKVKTACRTCKIRKVKCDETRPACQRCLSTGRKCDGYGVWDRPVRKQHLEPRSLVKPDLIALKPNCFPSSVSSCSSSGLQCLEWFLCRTVIKLPGTFRSFFWDKLLLQASISEPAVFHAVLALGSVHKDGAFVSTDLVRSKQFEHDEERNTTHHYLQSIGYLKDSFAASDQRSIRVILIACIAYVCLDFLRGHFEAGQSHLRKGMQVLDQAYHPYHVHGEYGSNDDDWILEIFARLDLMVKLFRRPSITAQSRAHLCTRRRIVGAPTSYSLRQAWKDLQGLFDDALALHALSDRYMLSQHSTAHPDPTLQQYQQRIDAELDHWLQAYQTFVDGKPVVSSAEMRQVHHILYCYHHMALIMVRTALRAGDEIAFDDHTDLFQQIVQRMCKLREIIPAHYEGLDEEGLRGLHEYLSDIGWITPLYYTASRCRHHRLRLQAVRLLESSFHREGIWDSITTACVARKIMTMEERDFYKDIQVSDDFKLTSPPVLEDLKLPTIPRSHRLHEAEMELSGTPMDEVHLFCHRLEDGTDRRVLLSTYNVHTQSWRDCSEG